MSAPTATLVRRFTEAERWRGDAALYRLSEPAKYEQMGTDEPGLTEYVVVSAIQVPYVGGVETFIFPANVDGSTINMLEMPGSIQGVLSHEVALAGAGYIMDDAA